MIIMITMTKIIMTITSLINNLNSYCPQWIEAIVLGLTTF